MAEKKSSGDKGGIRSYENMLKGAMEKMPEKQKERKRFEIPKVQTFRQGNKTIIKNFGEIVSDLRRDPKHLSKYLFKQLATPGNIKGDRLVLQRKVRRSMIQGKLEDYIKEFVYCSECGEPDTLFVEKEGIKMMKCEACGARSSVRQL